MKKLSSHKPSDTLGLDKDKAAAALDKYKKKLAELQTVFYADGRRSLLVVLQGMDTSGKDGVIRHVFSGVNPQGCSVTSFKEPSKTELAHDFLWRIHRACPAKGMIGVFNRSHYEDVVIARVHGLVSKDVWKARYGQINAFEKHLADNGTVILKFFLHISKEEQKERLESRLEDPKKRWKANPRDFEERKYWNDYMRAYSDALEHCDTRHAPWHVVPADRNWVRNHVVAKALTEKLESLKLKWPNPK